MNRSLEGNTDRGDSANGALPLGPLDPVDFIWDRVSDGMRLTDSEGKILRVNRAFCDLVEKPPSELEGQPFSCIYEDRERHHVTESYRRRLAQGHFESRMRRQLRLWNGRQLWLDTTVTVIGRDNPKVLTIFRDISDLKQAEEAVNREKQRFSDLIDSLSVGTWEWEVPTGQVRFNARWAEIVGYRLEELRPSIRTWIDLVHPDDLQRSERALEAHFSGETEFYECECRMRAKDGSWIWVLDRGRVVAWTEDRKPLRVVGADIDITQQKRLEGKLRESEEHFRALFDSIPVMVWLAGPDRSLIGFNRHRLEFTGKSIEDERGAGWIQGVHPDDVERCLTRWEAALDAREPFELEYRLLRHDGRYRWLLDRGVPRVGPNGDFLGYVGGCIDITDRREAESRLHEANIKLRQLGLAIEQSPVSIVLCDRDANITYVNAAFSQVTGYSSQEVLGQNARILKSGRMDPSVYRAMWAALLAGKPWRGEILNRRKNGELYWELAVMAPVLDDQGHINSYLAVKEDISAAKEAEEALRRTNLQLEEAVSRARELGEKAESASQAKSEFLANMSHEIRTPLNGVIGMCELLLYTELSEEQRIQASVIRSSGEALLALINDILDLSKIEAGKIELEQVPVDLRSLVEQVADILGPQARAKGLEFITRIPAELPSPLCGDPTRLRQVLLNLSSNAVKFTAQGQVSIDVEILSRQDREVVLRFSVRDTGIGIPQDKVDRLFQKFTQLDSSTAREYGGTGLGLAISKQLVALMNGEITIDSLEGQGSTFAFTARFVSTTAGEPERSAVPALVPEPGTPPPGRHTGMADGEGRILVVEDNPVNQRVALGLLHRLGEHADVAVNGADAVEAVKSGQYGLVFMDIQMPVVDGYEATQMIRALAGAAGSVPVIAMTANAMAEDRERCFAAGMDDFVAKPFNLDALKSIVKRWLHRPQAES